MLLQNMRYFNLFRYYLRNSCEMPLFNFEENLLYFACFECFFIYKNQNNLKIKLIIKNFIGDFMPGGV